MKLTIALFGLLGAGLAAAAPVMTAFKPAVHGF